MSVKAKKHLLINLTFIIGTIIGIFIFGEPKSYFMTLTGMISGYWVYHNVWAGRKNDASNESKCNKHIVNGSALNPEWEKQFNEATKAINELSKALAKYKESDDYRKVTDAVKNINQHCR